MYDEKLLKFMFLIELIEKFNNDLRCKQFYKVFLSFKAINQQKIFYLHYSINFC